MDKNYKKIKIFMMAAVVVLAFGAQASADWGMGYGRHGGMHQGGGWHHKGYACQGYGYMDELTQDEIKALEEKRKAFFEATKELRQDIYQKRLELGSELAKQSPDAAKATALQKEMSAIQAQLAQKRLDYIIGLRKINPDFGRGFMGGGPMGPGMMDSGMMQSGMTGPRKYGHWGSSYCPYGGPGGGYGMGPDMMGPGGGYGMGSGMMRQGGGKGMMGPGGSGSADFRQYHGGQSSLADEEK